MKKITTLLLALLTSLMITTSANAEFFRDVIVTSPNAIWTDSRTFTSLSDAISAIGSNKQTLTICKSETLSSDLTIPENITLKFAKGSIITVPSGVTLNINGNIDASPVQIFDTTAYGSSVTFGDNNSNLIVYPEWWGAARDGITDDSGAINAAVATGKTVRLLEGNYFIAHMIDVSTSAQTIQGSGQDSTIILVDSTFDGNLTGEDYGIFDIVTPAPGPTLEEFQIQFAQPDTAIRANLIAYYPAIYAVGITGFELINLKIVRAYDGINMTENTGGARIVGLRMSMFNKGIEIDGALDTVRIENFHIWPFGMSESQRSIFYDTTTEGMNIKQSDDLKLSDGLFICGTSMVVASADDGANPYIGITNVSFDAFSRLTVTGNAGNGPLLRMSNCYFSTEIENYQLIFLDGGNIQIENAYFLKGYGTTIPLISVLGTNCHSNLTISNSFFYTAAADISSIVATGGGPKKVHVVLMGNYFNRFPNVAYTRPTIDINVGVELVAIGNICLDTGDGSGTFIDIAEDRHHIIEGNRLLAWKLNVPAGSINSYYRGNVAAFSDVVNSQFIGADLIAVYEGTLNTSGNAVFAHGIGDLHRRALTVSAYYASEGYIMKSMTVDSIDGTNISLSGGEANVSYKCTVMYARTMIGW